MDKILALGPQTNLVYDEMPSPAKKNHMENFQHDRDRAAGKELNNNCRSLISTSKVFGVGFTLQRTHRVLLMEPDWLIASEEQAFAREHHMGILNPKIWARRLVTRDNKIDQQVISRQKARGTFDQLVIDPGASPPPSVSPDDILIFPDVSSSEPSSPEDPKYQWKTVAKRRRKK